MTYSSPMVHPPTPVLRVRHTPLSILGTWSRRRWLVAAGVALGFALLLGLSTVLIPNPVFSRDIATLPWNYPVWLVTSLLVGLLSATYVRQGAPSGAVLEATERRSSRMGMAGGFLAWFAVGCPVCNKIALIALGYSGAITWFAPVQPFLAVAALVLTAAALWFRLRGEIACTVPTARVRPGGDGV